MRFSLGNWAEARGIPLHHGGKLAEQPLNVFPALHPVAEHLGQGLRALQVQHGVGRDPCREGHQYILHYHDGLLKLQGCRRIPAKGSRGQGIEPQCQCKCLAGAIGRGERDLASGIAQAQQNGVVMLSGHLMCSRRWMPHGYTRTGRISESFRPPFGHQGLQRFP